MPANDLLAANARGRRLLPGIEEWPEPRRNNARYTFLHPAARSLYGNWEDVAAATVAHLRAAAGRYPDAPDVTGVAGELVVRSSPTCGSGKRCATAPTGASTSPTPPPGPWS
ncbi:hypothetical protein [Streptomyces sp. SP2-10]|uniref:MmyB family transcriptional regulator n=1 Tax=Streptomyces sp. SP2-10 TaxID=2873385 RepID=UPI001CA6F39E|nr:hypothetical protein [Streptomyces sp. SP2-10]MBY8842946.1 hypothetical protein [Streptomyces sp. SP2-10]